MKVSFIHGECACMKALVLENVYDGLDFSLLVVITGGSTARPMLEAALT